MVTKVNHAFGLLLIGLLLGCGGGDYSVVPASGTVTMDGNPAAGVRVIFSPLAVGDNHSPGPYSIAVTDGNGGFALETRYGNSGAIVGPHRASFYYVGGDEMAEKFAMAKNRIEQATAARDTAALAEAKKEHQKLTEAMAKVRAMPGRYQGRYGIEIEIPKGGDDALKFELTSDE